MSRLPAILALAAAALVWLAPARAHAYGPATHAWLAEEDAYRLAAADPALAFLAQDADARACFMYGATFPDVRGVAKQAGAFETIRRRALQGGLVASVEFSTDGVATAFASFDTHDGRFLLSLVAAARATGDRHRIAFALGNLAHALQDKHSQVVHIPSETQRRACGDLGVEPVEDPARAAGWYPGYENELVFEGAGDLARPRAAAAFVKDAPWRLAANATVSYGRALELRRFYFGAADRFARAAGRAPPAETAILNAAKLFEVALTFYPFVTAHEPIGDALRSFAERYLRLSWWAGPLAGVLQAIAANLAGGRDLFDLLGPVVLGLAGGQGAAAGAGSPLTEIIFASGQGGAEAARVRAKYAANPEFARLEASGFLDRATYHATDYEGAHLFVLDGCVRLGASRLTDDARWPVYSRKVMKGAGIRSLMIAAGREDVALAPDLLVFDVRHSDAATGAPVSEVALPADLGRRLRVEAEVFGASVEAAPRILRLRLRADARRGRADPVLAERTRLVPAAALALGSYGAQDRPVIAVEWTVADVPGALGVYVEMDERRLSPAAGDEAADAALRTELSPLDGAMGGRPHYTRHYASYGAAELGAVRIRR